MTGTVQIHGMDELMRRLRMLPDKVQRRVMQAALRAGLRPFVLAARREAPQRTGSNRPIKGGSIKPGTLKRLIRSSVKRLPRQKAVRGRVFPKTTKRQRDAMALDAAYARHVIRGTKAHPIPTRGFGVKIIDRWFAKVHHPGAKPDPFLDRAFSSGEQQAMTAFRDKFISKLEEEARKG